MDAAQPREQSRAKGPGLLLAALATVVVIIGGVAALGATVDSTNVAVPAIRPDDTYCPTSTDALSSGIDRIAVQALAFTQLVDDDAGLVVLGPDRAWRIGVTFCEQLGSGDDYETAGLLLFLANESSDRPIDAESLGTLTGLSIAGICPDHQGTFDAFIDSRDG